MPKKKSKRKERPPRMFLDKKGRLYVILNGKKLALKIDGGSKKDDYSKRELLDIILKKRVRRKRKSPKKKVDKKKRYDELERLNKLSAPLLIKTIENALKEEDVNIVKEKRLQKIREKKEQKLIKQKEQKLLKPPSKATFTKDEEFALIVNTLKSNTKKNKKVIEKIADDRGFDIKKKRGRISLIEITRQILPQYENSLDFVKDLKKEGVDLQKIYVQEQKKKPIEEKEEKIDPKQKSITSFFQRFKKKKDPEEFLQETEEEKQQVESSDESSSEESQIGDGRRGMYGSEIEDILKGFKQFIGVVPMDHVGKLDPKGKKQFCFVVNTDTSKGKGKHWVACYVDTNKQKTIEYYDSMADDCPKMFQSGIKKLIDKLKIPIYLKFKHNMIRNQKYGTDTCGIMCVMYLLKRMNGGNWKFSSGYTDLKEDEANEMKINYGYL